MMFFIGDKLLRSRGLSYIPCALSLGNKAKNKQTNKHSTEVLRVWSWGPGTSSFHIIWEVVRNANTARSWSPTSNHLTWELRWASRTHQCVVSRALQVISIPTGVWEPWVQTPEKNGKYFDSCLPSELTPKETFAMAQNS